MYRSAKRIQQEIHIVDELKNQWGSRYYLSVANNFSILAKDAIIDLYGKYSKEKINIKIEDASITSTVYNVSKGISEIGVIRFPVYKKSILNQILTMENLEYCALARENACVVVGKNNSLYHIENNTIAMEHLKNCRFATYVSETTDNIWMNFLQELGIDYRNIALANVGHLMAAIRKTDLAFIDTKKDHTHNSWYEDIRYIEIEPPVVCELGYIHKKAVDISEIGEEYLSILKKRICAWKNMVVEN